MKTLANIIWFVLGGIWLGLAWAILGILLCITIIGIPLGTQCFKAAKLTFMPFGKKVATDFSKHSVANTIWILLLGWEMAIGYFISGILCCITIIGIPVGIQSFKLMSLALVPFGARIIKDKNKNSNKNSNKKQRR